VKAEAAVTKHKYYQCTDKIVFRINVFMATRVACLPQTAFSNRMLCTTW